MILELRLFAKLRGAVDLAEVVGLNQPGRRVHISYGTHREYGRAALFQQNAYEIAIGAAMWIPKAVEPAESRGGQWFVDWRVPLEPGKPRCERSRIFR
jgi:hypothetical protein